MQDYFLEVHHTSTVYKVSAVVILFGTVEIQIKGLSGMELGMPFLLLGLSCRS